VLPSGDFDAEKRKTKAEFTAQKKKKSTLAWSWRERRANSTAERQRHLESGASILPEKGSYINESLGKDICSPNY